MPPPIKTFLGIPPPLSWHKINVQGLLPSPTAYIPIERHTHMMFPWLTSSSFWSGAVVGVFLGVFLGPLTMILVIMYLVRSTRR